MRRAIATPGQLKISPGSHRALPLSVRVTLTAAALLAFAAAFFYLYPLLARPAGYLYVVPVTIAALFFGPLTGGVVGLAYFPVQLMLESFLGVEIRSVTSTVWVTVMSTLVGYGIGAIRNLVTANRRDKELLAIAFEAAQDGLWDYRVDTQDTYFSPRWFTMLGYEPDELPHGFDTLVELLHPEDRDATLRGIDLVIGDGRPQFNVSFRLREKSGRYRWILSRGKIVDREPGGKARRMVGVHSDISNLKLAESELVHLAYHDQLTGLGNRKAFYEQLDQLLAQMERSPSDEIGAVLLLDLDNFKDVNDGLGHDSGDELLRQVTDRLRRTIRKSDVLFRWGGDEFIIVLGRLKQETDAALVSGNLIKIFAEPFMMDGNTIYTGASIGIAVFPRDGTEPSELVRKADSALYASKRDRNTYHFYTKRMQNAALAKMNLVNQLRRAVEEEEFLLHYQPIVTAAGNIIGAEALLRWMDPQNGLRMPLEFVGTLEETGLMLQVGRWVMARAAVDISRCLEYCRDDFYVSVNLSPRQLRLRSIMEDVDFALTAGELDARRLILELTEGSLVDTDEQTAARLAAFKEAGIRLAIDDFGTGYSSMSYLKRLPVDKIKIDRSFVVELPQDKKDVSIVQAISTVARGLDLEIVAEGVDSPAQVDFLSYLGCGAFQGYYYSKPVLLDQLMRMLRNNIALPADRNEVSYMPRPTPADSQNEVDG